MRATGPILILSLLLLPAAAQEKEPGKKQEPKTPEGWIRGETDHYILFTEDDRRLLKRYEIVLEVLFDRYAGAFGFKGELPRKAVVFLHKDRESYVDGGGSRSSVAYYDHEKEKLVAYKNKELLQFLAHEATHQFFDLAFPDFFDNDDVPLWFSEGIAECFCNCELRGGTLFINNLNTANAYRNVEAIQKALKESAHVPLQEMLDMPRREFLQKADILYPQGWSFCHFLWNYPRVNGKGKYFGVIRKLIEAFKKGKKREAAYKEAFGSLKLQRLEAEWKAYVAKLKAKRPSGSDD